jgi:hypothetical protein
MITQKHRDVIEIKIEHRLYFAIISRGICKNPYDIMEML